MLALTITKQYHKPLALMLERQQCYLTRTVSWVPEVAPSYGAAALQMRETEEPRSGPEHTVRMWQSSDSSEPGGPAPGTYAACDPRLLENWRSLMCSVSRVMEAAAPQPRAAVPVREHGLALPNLLPF